MDIPMSISYTLQLVQDDLRSRMTQLTQDVTSYDHLMYLEHELQDESPFHAIKEHYNKIRNIQERIREEIRHINIQLRTMFDEHNSVEHDLHRKVWIIDTARKLKTEFVENLTRLRLMQQNFIQSHKSKIFDLERKIIPTGPVNLELQQKIDLYRNCLSRCETDIHVNSQIVDHLNRSMETVDAAIQQQLHSNNGENNGGEFYDTVDIDRPNTVTNVHSVHIDASTQQTRRSLESLKREQNLLLVIIIGIFLTMLVTTLLMFKSNG